MTVPVPSKPRAWALGAISLLGLLIGSLGPSVFTLRLAPAVPEAAQRQEMSTGAAVAAPSIDGQPTISPPLLSTPTPTAGWTIGPPDLTHCIDSNGKSHTTCDKPAFEAVLLAKLGELGACVSPLSPTPPVLHLEIQPARGAVNLLSDTFRTIAPPAKERRLLSRCLRGVFQAVDFARTEARYQRYRLNFRLTPPPATTAQALQDTSPVVWDQAIVRTEPSGRRVAQISRGNRVRILERRAGWTKIDHAAGAGWVQSDAIASAPVASPTERTR